MPARRALLLGVGARDGLLSFAAALRLSGCRTAVLGASAAGRAKVLRLLCPEVRLVDGGLAAWEKTLARGSGEVAFLTADFPLWDEEGAAAEQACARARVRCEVVCSPSSAAARLSEASGASDLPQNWFGGFRVARGTVTP